MEMNVHSKSMLAELHGNSISLGSREVLRRIAQANESKTGCIHLLLSFCERVLDKLCLNETRAMLSAAAEFDLFGS